MEVYVLVARRWTRLLRKKQLDLLLTKTMASARVSFSSIPLPHIEWMTRSCSFVSLKWRDQSSTKVIEPSPSDFEALNEASKRKAASEFSKDIFDKGIDFEDVSLPNGKSIRFEDGQVWGEDGELIQDLPEDKITYDGRVIAIGKFAGHRYFNNKVWLKVVLDKERSEYSYQVIDFGPALERGADPNVREVIRDSGRFRSKPKVEQESGNLWWNNADTILKEGQAKLKLPRCRSIISFQVFKNYIAVIYEEFPSSEEVRAIKPEKRALYYRNFRTAVQDFPENYFFSPSKLGFFTLKPDLTVFGYLEEQSIYLGMLSGRRASKLGEIAFTKARDPSKALYSSVVAALAEVKDQFINLYFSWS